MNHMTATRTRVRQLGMSMIELMVALAIGSFLIIGAVTVQSQTRKTFDVNEQEARLQETARFVLTSIEPDLQMAGLYGYTQDPNSVMWSNGGSLTPPSDVHKGTVPGIPDSLTECGENFAVDVLMTVSASNGKFIDCDDEGGGHVDGTDVLTLRRAATTAEAAPSTSRLQIFSNQTSPWTMTRLAVAKDAAGAGIEGDFEVRNMIVQSFYIATDAEGYPGVPALRVKFLDTDGTDPIFRDQEVVRGVEDLQVQFGVDPGADLNGDGIPDDEGGDGMADFVNGYAARYVNPGDAILTSAQVVAVRLWVRVRADREERGFVDKREYKYADTDFKANDGFRRIVMSRTIFLRNSRQQ
jgi:type IV pilus assembly protein PilW